jgi:hypothetical protein
MPPKRDLVLQTSYARAMKPDGDQHEYTTSKQHELRVQSPVMERIRGLLERPKPKQSTPALYGSAKTGNSALEELEASRESWNH